MKHVVKQNVEIIRGIFLSAIWNDIVQAGQQRLRVAIETLEKQSKELDGMIDGYSVGYFK